MLEAGDAASSAEFVDTTGSPSFDDVQRWIGERIVAEGEPVELRRGSIWAGAYLEAVEEMAQGLKSPSPEYRRRYALGLGLERMLGADEPHLASGLPLRAHQVDALAGMLAAVIGDYERQEADEAAELELDDEAPRLADESQAVVGDTGGDEAEEEEELVFEDDDEDEAVALPPLVDEAPVARVVLAGVDEDEDDEDGDVDEDEDEATGEHETADPGAIRRYRFKHPTASGKTVAAAAFVDAAKITGVLILTHRRLLVDQFTRDLKEQGYGHRLKEPVLGVARPPVVPPITIETYAWFIKNADRLSRETYGVILCDEAHTALGDRTSAAIRRLDTPTYIGMTARTSCCRSTLATSSPLRSQTSRSARPCSAVSSPRCAQCACRPARRSSACVLSAAISTSRSSPTRSTTMPSTWPPPCTTSTCSASAPASSTRPASTTLDAWPPPCAQSG